MKRRQRDVRLLCDRKKLIALATALVGVMMAASREATAKGDSVSAPVEWRIMDQRGAISSGSASTSAGRTPLGSLWKLFVYAYQTETGRTEDPYTCTGSNPEEIFCCKPGESIDRDTALARSCSPYFSHERLGISAQEWESFWKARIDHAPQWLTVLGKPMGLRPETRVAVPELLKTLVDIHQKFKTRGTIESATLGTVLFGTGAGALKTWGSTLRVKTFTWRDAEADTVTDTAVDQQGFTGGFAGWLRDGSAIWVSRAGHGRDAFQAELKEAVDGHLGAQDSGCVQVNYFDRYPIAQVEPSRAGPLVGPVRIKFKNGNSLRFKGDGSLVLYKTQAGVRITARLSTNEYVARVLDREVKTTPLDAARAFSILARTYLGQNGKEADGCLAIADSSHLQRVSPEVASPMAIAIARWSDGLVLDRVKAIRYHSTKDREGVLSWETAKNLARSGYSMVEILNSAYPTGVIRYGESRGALLCTPNELAEKWVRTQAKSWARNLLSVPGFERPDQLKVCAASNWPGHFGPRVFADLVAQEIYIPNVRSRDDEMSVLHEYLHVGFRNHPLGTNELFIEKLARRMLEEE